MLYKRYSIRYNWLRLYILFKISSYIKDNQLYATNYFIENFIVFKLY